MASFRIVLCLLIASSSNLDVEAVPVGSLMTGRSGGGVASGVNFGVIVEGSQKPYKSGEEGKSTEEPSETTTKGSEVTSTKPEEGSSKTTCNYILTIM